MHIQTLALPPVVKASASTLVRKPGIYRGESAAEFGLWRLRTDGIWLYCAPVAGAVWKKAIDQNPGDKLIMLVDETRI